MQYKVQDPQGNLRIIEGPDGATDSEVISQAQKLFSNPSTSFEANRENIEPGVMGDTVPVEMKALKAINIAGAGMGVGQLAGLLGKGAVSGVEGLSNLVKEALPNPSLKALGANASNTANASTQELAQAAKAYGTSAQPEVGELVAKAGQNATEGLSTSPAQASIFEQPIIKGIARPAKEMKDLAIEHHKQIGEAISNTLTGLENTGTKFDPKPIIDQAEGMLEKDINGNIMKSGVQGDKNDAIQEALSSLKDYSTGKSIPWADANKIKGLLQDSAKYAAKRFDDSNEAYKQVASLIKEGIDDQASNVLEKTGGNIQEFQNLRKAYGKVSVLKDMLTRAAGKDMLQPSTAEAIVGRIGHALPYATGTGAVYYTLKKLLGGFDGTH